MADEETPIVTVKTVDPIVIENCNNDEESVSSRTIVGSNVSPKSDNLCKGRQPCPLKDANLAELPVPTEQPQEVKPQTAATSSRPALLYRWILIALSVAVTVLVLGIALSLALVRHHKHSTRSDASTSTSDGVQSDGSGGSVTAGSPPVAPTSMPAFPTPEYQLQETLRQVLPTDLYERMTTDLSSTEYASFLLLLQEDPLTVPPTLQRFILAHWDNAVGGNAFLTNVSECQWEGIQCDTDNIVRSIQWNNRNLTGRLPDSMLSSLTTIDFGDNALQGSIPATWYQNATSLQYLYLHNNVLTGTISTHVAHWESLRRLYLGTNQLSGSLPQELGSAGSGRDRARPLEYLLLQDNNLNGSLPLNWNLRNLFYLDLGDNQLTGGIPTDWVQGNSQMHSLRVLYLDRNRFSGDLPSRFGEIGNARLSLLSIHDNLFSGSMPIFYNFTMKLNIMEIYNNEFSSMDREMCKHSVYEEGELVVLAADCGICPCKNLCSDELCKNKQLL